MYVVFAVDSVDRLTLASIPSEGQTEPTLRLVTLAFIDTLQQGRRNVNGEFTEDEPFAYEAVQLIRSRFIGAQVNFKEDYYVESLQRSAGRITLVDGGLDASTLLLEEGFAAVPLKAPAGMDNALHKKYVELMKGAFKKGKGIFASEKEQAKHVRRMSNLPADQLAELVKPFTGKMLRAEIVRIISTTTIVIMAVKEFGFVQIPSQLTGITTKGVDESILREAKSLCALIQHRHVNVCLDGIDGFGNVLVTIHGQKTPFQEELLLRGLAKVNRATCALSASGGSFLAAEDTAKENHRGVWKNYAAPEPPTRVEGNVCSADPQQLSGVIPTFDAEGKPGPAYNGPIRFTGKLVQVIHADTLVIREDRTKELIRVALAGIRSSKAIQRDSGGAKSAETRVTYSEYSWESREFVRQRFIGAGVVVKVEYARIVPQTTELRPAAIVIDEGTGINIAVAVVEAGLASVFLGRNGTCSCVGELRDAETEAKESERGIHSGVESAQTKILELSHLGEARSRYYLSFLQRGMQGYRPPIHHCLVDVVVSGNSLRAYIPKEKFQIPVRLAGVIAPSNQGTQPDPFFQESRNFLADLLQQREAQVQVFSTDRAGNFISAVFLSDGTNVAVELVRNGLASCGNADRLPFYEALMDAEEAAKAEKKYIWGATEALPQRAVKMAAKSATRGGKLSVVTGALAEEQSYVRTEISEDGLTLFIQPYTEEAEESKEAIRDLLDQLIASTVTDPSQPKTGQSVAALYKADKLWHRAKVLKLVTEGGETLAEVQFIDYGNTQRTPLKNIRSIPKLPQFKELLDIPPLAIPARLAFINPRLPSEGYELACNLTFDYTEGRELIAKAVYKDASGNMYYSIKCDDEHLRSLSEELLAAGAAFLDKKTAALNEETNKGFDIHSAASLEARSAHIGLWVYGDADDEED